jgi:hypothetical protein
MARFVNEAKGIDTRPLKQKLTEKKVVSITHRFNILIVSVLLACYLLSQLARYLEAFGRSGHKQMKFDLKITGDEDGVLINGVFNGPEIHVNKGQVVVVNVENLYKEPVAVHFHGLTNMIEEPSNCDIAPNTTFSYVFQPNDPGSHWYHAVSQLQKNRGLYGALIVHDPEG